MANIASIFQVPETPESAASLIDQTRDIEESGAHLLELRTENGAVYLCPSRWQRLRLQWTFRHFHVLSPQVLSHADKRLIEKLSQSAVVTPHLPVASTAVLGVVEKVRPKAPPSVNRVVTLRPASSAKQVSLAKPLTPGSASPDLSVVLKPKETKMPGAAAANDVRGLPFQQWRELGVLAAVGFMVMLISIYRVPLPSSLVQTRNPQKLSTSIQHAGNGVKSPDLHRAAFSPVLVSPTALIPYVGRPKRWIEPPPVAGGAGAAPAPALATVPDTIPKPAPIARSAASGPLFIAQLPQGHFARPVVPENLVGELQLKALIGVDGAVKKVTVLSGRPALAEAGVRAVRQWHYSPYQVDGAPVEVETQIKMSFFGQDAVSIASVASGSTSQPR
jgi:hypothetical protein